MKILIFINGLYPETIGGIEKIGTDLAERLAGRHEVVVYTKYKTGFPSRERRNGFSIVRFKSSDDYRVKIWFGIRTLNVLRELGREKPKPDVILSMSLGYGYLGLLARKLYGVPYLAYVLGTDWYIARDKRMGGSLYRYSLRKCDLLVTQTGIIRNDILEHVRGVDIEVIPNGIDLPGRKADGGKIIYLGRLHKVKGIEYLIEAVRTIENPPPLVIAGSGPEENRLKNRAMGLDISFPGRVTNVEDLFLQGKFFVLPSLSEGLPQVILEAMSYGLPVIATNVGGIAEIIEHGRTGFLVDPADVDGLRVHMERLLDDEQLRRTMSGNCLEEVKKYSWDSIAEKIERAMEKARGRSRRPTAGAGQP